MSIGSLYRERKCLELLVMVAQHCEHTRTKSHQTLCFQMIKVVNFISKGRKKNVKGPVHITALRLSWRLGLHGDP